METAIKLVELPWATLLMVASGYAGYFIAHLGVRDHHKAADVTFGTLMFGFWGVLAYQYCLTGMKLSSLTSSVIAMLAAVLGKPAVKAVCSD